DLADESDAGAELARQSDAGEETHPRIGLDGVDEAVGDVGDGVQEYRSEEDRHAPALVAEDPPEDAAEEHAAHLHVDEVHARPEERLLGDTEILETRDA